MWRRAARPKFHRMKTFSLLLIALVFMSAKVQADEQMRQVQSALKEQGFYFGEIDGTAGPELSAATKRYQIRNGLEVTGTITDETMSALGLRGAPAAPPRETLPPRTAVEPSSTARPRVDLRKDQALVESDRRALRETAPTRPPRETANVPPPEADRPVTRPDRGFSTLFARTPYASAPPALQEETLRAAQRMLASRGFYRDPVDGQPGPATEEAVLSYQRASQLPLSGRLDLETLNTLHLLPGPNTANPMLKPFAPDRRPPATQPQRVYRGVWVD